MKDKKILLISNKVYHYRVSIYNYFYENLKEEGNEFRVLTNELQSENTHELLFECAVKKFSVKEYFGYINDFQPDIVIFFLHLKDWIVWPLMPFLKRKKIPFIYWGHGVNLQDPDNKLKKQFFNILHKSSSAIILYSPDQKHFIKPSYQHKIFIAPNTLNYHAFSAIEESKQDLKERMNIPYEKVVLFVGRIQQRKRLDVLLDIFKDKQEGKVGLVIAGPDATEEQLAIIQQSPMITYLGPLYDDQEINAVFKLSDIFSIPGTMGLGLNQAFYWGLPIITMKVYHSPEIYYLEDGYNGFMVKPEAKYVEEKINFLVNDEHALQRYSENAKETANEKSGIKNMIEGFYEAFKYVLQ